jgi:hypothetical protein
MGIRFLKRRERPGSYELARRGQAMELIGLLASWATRKRRKDVGRNAKYVTYFLLFNISSYIYRLYATYI